MAGSSAASSGTRPPRWNGDAVQAGGTRYRGARDDALRLTVGIAAVVAPALHLVTDLIEWRQGGFSDLQLWLNYAAFLPMPWLLLGIYAVHRPRPHAAGLAGALLYGAAFTYFAFTTLYALTADIPDYATLWQQTGVAYTLHGALMIAGGLLFAAAVLRAEWLPRTAVLLFLAGTACNLLFAVLSLPDIAQIAGSALRNLGLMGMGLGIVRILRQDSTGNG